MTQITVKPNYWFHNVSQRKQNLNLPRLKFWKLPCKVDYMLKSHLSFLLLTKPQSFVLFFWSVHPLLNSPVF